MAIQESATTPPRRKVDPGLIIAIVVGCIVATFVLRYAAKRIPNRAVGGLASEIAGDAEVVDKPESEFDATGDVRGVALTQSGDVLVGDRDAFTLRDPKSGKVLRTFDTDDNGVRTLAVSPSGNLVAVALSYSGEVRLYETAGDTKPLLSFHSPTDQEQQAVAFAPNGDSIASGGFDKTVRVWGVSGAASTSTSGAVFDTTKKTGGDKLQSSNIKVGDSVSAIAFSPNGKQVAVATGPKVTLYDIGTGKAGQVFYADKSTVTATAITPDGKQIAVGAAVGAILFFDTATGRRITTISGSGAGSEYALPNTGASGVTALVYGAQGKKLYATQKSGLLEGIDTTNHKITKIYAEQNTPNALSLAPSADGKQMAVGYNDGTVRIWKL